MTIRNRHERRCVQYGGGLKPALHEWHRELGAFSGRGKAARNLRACLMKISPVRQSQANPASSNASAMISIVLFSVNSLREVGYSANLVAKNLVLVSFVLSEEAGCSVFEMADPAIQAYVTFPAGDMRSKWDSDHDCGKQR